MGLAAAEHKALQQEIRQLLPIGGMRTPWEIAKAAVFLASDESRFVIGRGYADEASTGTFDFINLLLLRSCRYSAKRR